MYKSMVFAMALFMTCLVSMADGAVIDQDFQMKNKIEVPDQDKVSAVDPDHFLSSVSNPPSGLTKNKLRMVPDIGSRIRKLAGLVRMVIDAQRDKDYELRRLSRLIKKK